MAVQQSVTRTRSSRVSRILLLVGGIAVAYFVAPLLLLHFALDWFVFPRVASGTTHENRLVTVPVAADRSILIRQYGDEQGRQCAIFFPGQRGGISTYEKTLFPKIKQLGIAIYAVSYPGQDGAEGRSTRATLLRDVGVALAAMSRETTCQPENAVFIGRSLGASVAIYTAQRIRPRALLLDGIAPTLTVAIEAALRRHMVTRPWNLLPFDSFLKDNFPLIPIIQSLSPTPIVVFQGTDDQVTPFAQAQAALVHQENVRFFAVPGAAHDNAYLLAESRYSEQLAELMRR